MRRFIPLLTAAAAFAGAAALATPQASAASFCPADESFFGTVNRVNGNMLNVTTADGHGALVRIDSGARMNTNGYPLRRGTYVGAYGCVTPNGVFHASEITLSRSAATYHETISGVVDRVETGRLIVRQSGNRYGAWYVPGARRYARGQTVTGIGMLGRNGAFYPQTINGRTVGFQPGQ